MGNIDLTQISDLTVQSLIKIGKDSAATDLKILESSKIPYFIAGDKVITAPQLIFNEHMEAPERIQQTVTVYEPESFVEYFTLYKDQSSRVFADESQQTVTAVLDYHYARTSDAIFPRWGKHQLILKLRKSDEWNTWTAANNKLFPQESFVEFLEQNSFDIIKPSPAAMRELAGDLKGTMDVSWGASKRMNDGQARASYTETLTTTTSSGAVSVPEMFTLGIPVFVSGPKIEVEAYLRLRIKDTKLTFFYTLLKPQDKVRDAFLRARQMVSEELEIKIINGVVA